MTCFRLVARVAFLALLALPLQDQEAVERTADPAKEVVVLVNENVPESVAIGEYYATRRAIPKANICRIKTTPNEICDWAALRKDILEPLTKFLEDKPDILYIVPTWGVPVKTREEKPANDGKDGEAGPIKSWVSGRDYACIDREIELIKIPHEIDGWIASTVFRHQRRITREDSIYIVSRLDGPTAEAARGLVDLALYGEAYGIEGRALLDTRGLAKEDPLGATDAEMKEIAPLFERASIDFDHDDKGDVVDLATRESAGHYWGWYTGNVLCSKESWRFRPGAVGAHLHSFSGAQLRRTNQTWTGPLVHFGITGTCGTVYEPLVAGFPYGQVFFDRFLSGHTFGESMAMATMFTSWVAVYVGDPLYAPYAAGMKERQAKNRETAKTASRSIAAALDAGEVAKALEITKDVESIGVPYAGAEDTSFLVREAKSRAAFPERKAKGTVVELWRAIASANAAADPKQGLALARKAAELSPGSADAALVLARRAAEAGSAREALEAAEIVEKVTPGFDAAYWKGRALLLMKRHKEALASFDAALAARFDVDAARRAGEALVELKRYKEAIARLEDVVKRNPGEREVAVELGRALMATRDWRRSVEVLDAAHQDLPAVWSDLKSWASCAEMLAAALRSEGIEKERPLELLQSVREITSGRLRPTPPAVASKIAAAIDDAKGGEKLSELPVYDERSGGLPKLRIGNKGPAEIQVFINGPMGYTTVMKGAAPGKESKPVEVELAPGQYRIALVVTEKGSTPKKLWRDQPLFPGQVIALALDGAHQLYKP